MPEAFLPPACKTKRDLARLVGRAVNVVSYWVQKPDWAFGPPPWNSNQVADILRFFEKRPKKATSAEAFVARDEMKQARLEVLREQKAKLRMQRLVAERKLVSREDVEARNVELIYQIKLAFRGAFSEFANSATPHNRPDWGKIWVDVLDECCARVANAVDDEPDEDEAIPLDES